MVWSEAMNHAKSHFLETLCVSTRYQHRDRIYFNPERTMKSVHITIVAVVFTALISGCAPSAKDKLVGKWQGTVEVDNTKLQQKLGSETRIQLWANTQKGRLRAILRTQIRRASINRSSYRTLWKNTGQLLTCNSC